MKIKLVIFDLDGTLLDTRRDIAEACNHALESCGCPVRRLEEYNMMIGRGISNLFREALPEGLKSETMVEKMRTAFLPYYNSNISRYTRPYIGIMEMLGKLKREGISLAIASNKFQDGTTRLAEEFFPGIFDKVLGQRDGHPIKPDPEIINEIIRDADGADCSNTIYCGDSDVDMLTGINAGIRTIGVTWGLRSREELEECSPWLLADSPENIAGAILTLE